MFDRDQMISRQRILADFGDFALRSDRLEDVLNEACRLVGKALDTDLAKILEIEAGGDCALVKAGIGWKPGIVGELRLPLNDRSSETYSIKAAHPVISQNISAETRFEFADVLVDHGVVALVNAPIFLPGGKPYGLLQVDSRELREFGEREVEFLRTYTTVLGPVIDRLHKLHSLEQALDANQRLLQELQHRVKNHIGIIASLVRIRARQVGSDEARKELNAIGERIDTLRLVHEQLYAAGTTDTLRLSPFIMRLVENLCHLHEAHSGKVTLKFTLEEVELISDLAVPVGLILNEFVTNSLKYAFDGNGGTIAIKVEPQEQGRLRMIMSDDGKGLPAEPQAAAPGSSTGMRLIDALAHQIGAKPVWSASQPGTTLCLAFDRRT